MKLLLIGGSGQAGTALQRINAGGVHTVVAPSRSAADMRAPDTIDALVRSEKPDWIINFAAFHVLDACEDDFAAALAVNAVAVRALAQSARRADCRLLTVSTDYVFDGAAPGPLSENAPARPIQAYGVSKRAGELAALAAAPERVFVARTCGLYGHALSRERGANFVERRLADAHKQATLEVGSDLICTPTSAQAFAAAVLALVGSADADSGIYHLTAEGQCSWAEFTAKIFALAGAPCAVTPVDRNGNYGRIRRPANSVLANTRARALGIVLPAWQDDLAAYIGARA